VNFAFAGSPDFAARTLEHLVDLGRRPSLVITQPDRPVGRGRKATAPPAAVTARRLGLDLLQPADINAPEILERMRGAKAELLVVAAFGQILSSRLLDSILCINLHASLLPAHRGAAPIERALAAGESTTGATIMRITPALDSGPVALQTSMSIGLRDDAGSVARALAVLGAQGIDQVLTGLADGTLAWTEQEGDSVYAGKLGWVDCLPDFQVAARRVHDRVRSLSPRVGVRVESGSVRFKVWRTWPYGQPGLDDPPDEVQHVCGVPGEMAISSERMFVGCGQGVVRFLSVQPEGRGVMTAAAFLRGYRSRLGTRVEPADQVCRPADGSATEGV
jgi:methionyl-tRNA formyltransferase